MSSWKIALLLDGAAFLTLFIANYFGWIKTKGKKGDACMFIVALLLLCMILAIPMN